LLPNLLATRTGRLIAFCALYVTEGIPLGFAASAMVTEMKRAGFSVTDTGSFVGAIFLPWAFKWAVGPFVDTIYSRRLGRRRSWILAMQLLMVLSLFAIRQAGFGAGIATLTTLIIIHNCFGATQDVAIDALAVQTLRDDERGVANGLMFGGAFAGQAVGGGLALLVSSWLGFDYSYFFVGGAILLVTVVVVLPMREPAAARRAIPVNGRLHQIGTEAWGFMREAVQAFTAHRDTWLALVLALVPIGAQALGLAMTNNIAVELGLNDAAVGQLQLYTTIIGAVACVAGGWVSDRRGRRSQLTVAVIVISLATGYLAWQLQRAGYVYPLANGAVRSPLVPGIVSAFWVANVVFSIGLGYMYGVRAALFMDLTRPAVAATQFTAYMALINLMLSYSSKLEGMLAEHLGYPVMLLIDIGLGLVCLLILPFLRTVRGATTLRR
jgi:MFS transporter, PAT family, beta-lactamase induction signal transducer AmpG